MTESPPLRVGRAWLLVERNVMVYRRRWIIVATGFFEPLLYLLSIGIGLGSIIGRVEGPGGRQVEYVAYVAPALLASSAMNGAVYESTLNIYYKLEEKVFRAILATPLGPRDVALGELAWAQMRGFAYSTAFLLVMLGIGVVHSWWFLLTLPTAMLIGLAFSAVGMAVATFMRSSEDFGFVTVVLTPIFLFSTTFYPLDFYPRAVQVLVQLTPLIHAINLMRGFTLGVVGPGMIGDAVYLLVMLVAGYLVVTRRITRLMLS